jgi:hypothetical protein
MVKGLLGLAGAGAIAYGTLCLALWWGQTRLIFFPQPPPLLTPTAMGLTFEEVWIPVEDTRLHGWWLPAADPRAKTVLVFHGNATNVEGALAQALEFLQVGLNVLLIDYRGYGLSAGPFPNEAQVYEDAAAAWDYLTQIRRIPPGSIVIFGHSIGGAIAIELALHQPQAAGLIVQASFTSMADMVDHVGYSRFVPPMLLTQRFDSYRKIPHIRMPVLFIHGLEDATVPTDMGQRLYAAAPEPKQLWLVPGASHNDVAVAAEKRYQQTLSQWLSTLATTDASSR